MLTCKVCHKGLQGWESPWCKSCETLIERVAVVIRNSTPLFRLRNKNTPEGIMQAAAIAALQEVYAAGITELT